jgi:DNA topoisomerase-2
MYLGSTVKTESLEYLIIDKVFKQHAVNYVPALVKMINEIIDNSVDVLKDEKKGIINVLIDPTKNTISVKDNGSGIPIVNINNLDGDEILIPKACWAIAKSGSNFNDDAGDDTTIGTNGVGSFCVNVMSSKFIGITDDGVKKYSGTWSNNCDTETYKEDISKSTRKGTFVSFEPDLKRLGISDFNDDTIKVIRQRLINLAISYPNIKFTFNKEKIEYSQSQFLDLIGSNGNIYADTSGKYSYAVFPSVSGDFETFSLINGLNIKAGTHIDYLLKYVTASIKEKLPKRFDKISVGDIKNKLKIVFIGKEFPKIQWSGQTKEIVGNSNKDIRTYLGEGWKNILIDISKNKEIIEPITFLHEAKLDAEERKLAALVDKENKKSKVMKLRKAFKEKKYLFLTEGDSALKGIIKALGRENISYLPLRGVVANPYTNSIQKITKNLEYKDIMNVLDLKFSNINDGANMSHEYVILATDADFDGSHIKGLLLGFFHKMVPSVFEHKRILLLRTPIKVAKDKKENLVEVFLTEEEYVNFSKKKANNKYDIEYKKGLGSMNAKEYAQFFKLRPLDKCLVEIDYDDNGIDNMINWLSDDSEFRKEKIQYRIKDFNVDLV